MVKVNVKEILGKMNVSYESSTNSFVVKVNAVKDIVSVVPYSDFPEVKVGFGDELFIEAEDEKDFHEKINNIISFVRDEKIEIYKLNSAVEETLKRIEDENI